MSIKFLEEGILLTGKDAEEFKAKEERKVKLYNNEYDMPSIEAELIMSSKSILNRVDENNHYLNFGDKNCTDKEKKKLLEKFLNKIDRPDLLDTLCNASDNDIIMDILAETLNIRTDVVKVLSILDNINNFIGFKNFMLFVLDFINYEEKCNHIVMNGTVSHIDKYGKCDICGKIIPHDSLMIAKMLEII